MVERSVATIEPANLIRSLIRAGAWLLRLLELGFGAASLLVLLSMAAAVPVLNLLALGYLLHAQGQVARSGRFRDALPMAPAAARLGAIALGVGFWLTPLWYLADYARDARLIAPRAAGTWLTQGVLAGVALVVAMHLLLAIARGGRLDRFFRPLGNIGWLRSGADRESAEAALRGFIADLRLAHLLRLGACGFAGTLVWLAVPTLLLGGLYDPATAWKSWLALLGAGLLVLVLGWVPFLQVRFAAEERLGALFELGAVRALFRHAPARWWFATVALYASAIPLFLWSGRMKMLVQPHREILDLTFLSLATTFPAHVLVAWAYAQATRRPAAAAAWCGVVRLVLAVLLAVYVYLLFLSSLTAELGRHWFNEHHALLLPIPW